MWKLSLPEIREILKMVARKAQLGPYETNTFLQRSDKWPDEFRRYYTTGFSDVGDVTEAPAFKLLPYEPSTNIGGSLNIDNPSKPIIKFALGKPRSVDRIIHEGTHSSDKASAIAGHQIDPKWYSAKFLPDITNVEVPSNVEFEDWRRLSPMISLSKGKQLSGRDVMLDEDAVNILKNDPHSVSYYRSSPINKNVFDTGRLSTEALSQWAEIVHKPEIQKLPESDYILQHLAEDPRLKYDISFDKFMTEPQRRTLKGTWRK
jgi:hypothetical protein